MSKHWKGRPGSTQDSLARESLIYPDTRSQSWDEGGMGESNFTIVHFNNNNNNNNMVPGMEFSTKQAQGMYSTTEPHPSPEVHFGRLARHREWI